MDGPEEDIKGLLQSASVNESSLQGTPLIAAAKIGRLDLVQDLLQRGADPNATTEIGNQTALYQAAERGHVEIVKILFSLTEKNIFAWLHWTPLHVTQSLLFMQNNVLFISHNPRIMYSPAVGDLSGIKRSGKSFRADVNISHSLELRLEIQSAFDSRR